MRDETDSRSPRASVTDATESLQEKIEALKFKCLFNIALCEDGASHYRKLDVFKDVVTVVFGLGAVAQIFSSFPVVYSVVGFSVAVLGIVGVVVGFSRRLSEELSRKGKYESVRNGLDLVRDECGYADCLNAYADAEKGEARSNSVCDAVCFNIAVDQMGRDPSYKRKVGWLRYYTRHFIPWRME